MAKEEEVRNQWAACIGAAGCAAWWTLLVGFLILLVTGIMYLFVVHTPLIGAVAAVWGVGPKAVPIVMVVFIALYKMFLLVWLPGCVFLTAWARRLRSVEGE